MRPGPRALVRIRRLIWPQVPLALVLVAAGAINILDGIHTGSLGELETLGKQASFGALGSMAQITLGVVLVLSGFGLLWRVRVAWSFSILLLLITIGVNIAQSNFGGTMIVPVAVVLLLIALQHHFQRRTLLGNSLVSIVSVVAVACYGTFGIYLLGNQFEPRIHSLVTALYFLVETLSTTGYGDYHPVTHMAQGFMITVWVVGLSVFTTAVLSIAGPALTNRLNRILAPGGNIKMHRDHVILVGTSVIASNTAHELVNRGMDFVQLVGEEETPPLPDQPVVFGDASEDKFLVEAGINKARLLIAAEEDDGENAFISLAAKNLQPKLRVLVIASSRRAIRRLRLAHADMVFAPTEVGSRLLADLVDGWDIPDQFSDLFMRGES